MPSTTLTPSSVGNYDTWTLGAGANKTAAVTPPDDGDTTRIQKNNGIGGRQSYVMTNLPTEALFSTAHTVQANSKQDSGNHQVRGFIRSGGADTNGSYATPTASYADHNYANLISAVLTKTVIDAAEVGVDADTGTSNLYVSTLTWDVTYTPDSGGWVSLVVGWLGPVLGASLSLRDAFAIAAEVNRLHRGRARVHMREVRDMLDGLRRPQPRFVFMGAAA